MKVIMYGAPICGDCVAMKKALLECKDLQLIYRDITESTVILKDFLKIRDTDEMFDPIKEAGKIGIPLFVLEDGTRTFEIQEYLDVKLEVEEKTVNACSLDGKGNC